MPLLKSCLCCSLLQGSIVTGVYISVVYLAAFIMELSLVIEGENWVNSGREKGPLPLPAYILVVLHLIVIGLSVIMLYALYQRRVGVLLGWVFIFSLLFFPEVGILIFVVIFHWGFRNTYGLTEIIFYMVRAPVNILSVLCIHSLQSVWRLEASTEKSFKKLSTLQMVQDASGQPSINTGYLVSSSDISSLRSIPSENQRRGVALHYRDTQDGVIENHPFSAMREDMQKVPRNLRKYSSASHIADNGGYYPRRLLPVDMTSSPETCYPSNWDPLSIPDSRSEFNASLFPLNQQIAPGPYFAGKIPTGILTQSRSEQTIFRPNRSDLGYGMEYMMAIGVGTGTASPTASPAYDYYEMGSLSRSILDPDYVNRYRASMLHVDYSTQSLDRRRNAKMPLNFPMNPFLARRQMPPFHHAYPGHPQRHESKSSVGAESDDFRRYRDVAL